MPVTMRWPHSIYSRAGQLAQSGMDATPADPAAHMCAPRAAYETGRFSDALIHLRVVENQHPQAEFRTYAYNWLTVTRRKLRREREAMQHGQAAMASARRESSRQNLASALHNMGGLAYVQGNALKDSFHPPCGVRRSTPRQSTARRDGLVCGYSRGAVSGIHSA